jgi:hypothetical protein
MRTFIQPQKKQNEEKIEVKLDLDVIHTLRDYCEFLDSPQGYIVTEILRKAFRKDRAFITWRGQRDTQSRPAPVSKGGRRRGADSQAATAVAS